VLGAVGVEHAERVLVALEAAHEEQPQRVAPLQGEVRPPGEEPRVAVEGVVPRAGHAVAAAQAFAVLPAYCVLAAADCVAVRQVSAASRCCVTVPVVLDARCC